MSWTRISESVHRWSDTCQVYAIVRGTHCVLIDAGSGHVMDHMDEIGVTSIDWVLHTHHHRDQCWGTNKLRASGAQVAVPEHERHLFDNAELFWQHKRLYDNYNDRSTFNTVGQNIAVDRDLEDYEGFTWEDIEFSVLPAKGHTHGSSMLVASIDGLRLAFTGDLLAHGGTLHEYHGLEYNYGDRQGALFTLQSCQALRRETPDLALPSHGEVITDPSADCTRLESRLMDLAHLGAGVSMMGNNSITPHGLHILPEPRFIQVSRHLLWGGPHTCSNFYVLLSESGAACFIDYGHSFSAHMATGGEREDGDRMRFIVHHLDELRTRWGVTSIDTVLITHIHDDHTAGVPYLQRHEATEAWALDEVAQVLEDPAAWVSTPCTLATPIPISRHFSDGDRFKWNEFDFEVWHAPGQTEFHSVFAATIDGQKVAFTGDNIFLAEAPDQTGGIEPRIYQTTVLRNSYQLAMHRKCADVMEEIAPDLVCPGHRQLIPWDASKSIEYRDFINRQERIVRSLVGEPAEDRVDLFWARLRPYLTSAISGETLTYRLMLRNNHERHVRLSARLLWPDNSAATELFHLELDVDARGDLVFDVSVPPVRQGRQLLTAEILVDGVSRGPVTEAVLEIQN